MHRWHALVVVLFALFGGALSGLVGALVTGWISGALSFGGHSFALWLVVWTLVNLPALWAASTVAELSDTMTANQLAVFRGTFVGSWLLAALVFVLGIAMVMLM